MGKIMIYDKTNRLYLVLLTMWRILREVHSWTVGIYRCGGIFDGHLAKSSPSFGPRTVNDPSLDELLSGWWFGTWLLMMVNDG